MPRFTYHKNGVAPIDLFMITDPNLQNERNHWGKRSQTDNKHV